ncbi:unnamed protein product [Aphanomyces euteiches]
MNVILVGVTDAMIDVTTDETIAAVLLLAEIDVVIVVGVAVGVEIGGTEILVVEAAAVVVIAAETVAEIAVVRDSEALNDQNNPKAALPSKLQLHPRHPPMVEEVKKHNGPVGKIEMKLQKKDKETKAPSTTVAPVSNPVFRVEDEEEEKPQRGFVPLDYTDEEKLAATLEAQVARTVARINSRSDGLEGIIKNIPTDAKGLFRYPMDWRAVEQYKLVDEKMKPWVKKKIVEYLGEEEDTLIGFILRQLSQRAGAQSIVDELTPVLEQDAEVFVMSMWRKLIFEVIRAVADHEK